ncbi:hypothetical protein TOK_4178 [Pseudonocardia sp. N23]|nr:hypothetical protein TOK_4178 [Pseudonocardia sp. N23]
MELLDGQSLDREEITFALHAFGREPVRSEAITPMVLMKVQSIARELRARVGHDTAAARDLEDFYARMMSSMRGLPADEVTE